MIKKIKIASVVDIFPQLCYSKHDYKRISEEMELLASLGFKRVYFVVSGAGYPMFSSPWLSINEHEYNHALESIISVGDPNFAYMYECHKQGMEAFAIYKPYEGGGGSTIPHSKKTPFNTKYIDSIGGKRIGFNDYIVDNPHFRVKRKNDEAISQSADQEITDIEIKFCIDNFTNRVSSKGYFKHKNQNIDLGEIGFDIYVSEDNGKYELFKANPQFDYEYVKESIFDANGIQVSDTDLECLSISMRHINIPKEKKYVAVKIKYYEELFTIPNSMMKIYCNGTLIPSTFATHIRQPAELEKGFEDYKWGSEINPKQVKDISEQADGLFQNMGFEFEWHGSGFWGDGWSNSPYIAVAKGKFEYMKGTLCEAYPEVRKYWLDEIDKLLEMGYDGIDMRLQNHSGMVSDYCSYGYNEPISNKYLEKYGVDINHSDGDPMKIMKIRGDFFLEFLKDVSKLVHKNEKKLQMHLKNCHEEPILSHEFNELGFWAMPKVALDWKKAIECCDEITIKDYFFNDYDPSKCRQIKSYAKSQNKNVWIHSYIAQGNELNKDYIGNVINDDEIDGILLYEVAHNTRFEINRGLINQDGEVRFNEDAYNKMQEILCEYKCFDLKDNEDN